MSSANINLHRAMSPTFVARSEASEQILEDIPRPSTPNSFIPNKNNLKIELKQQAEPEEDYNVTDD